MLHVGSVQQRQRYICKAFVLLLLSSAGTVDACSNVFYYGGRNLAGLPDERVEHERHAAVRCDERNEAPCGLRC